MRKADYPSRHSCRCIPGGFTLVELLVAIVIISILAAMLLPTLRVAINAGRDITCKNNLKQIGFSFLMYADSSGGRLPTSSSDVGLPTQFSWMVLSAFYSGLINDMSNTAWNTTVAKTVLSGNSLFSCPSDQSRYSDGNLKTNYAINAWYYMPKVILPGGESFLGVGICFRKLSSIPQGSELVMASDYKSSVLNSGNQFRHWQSTGSGYTYDPALEAMADKWLRHGAGAGSGNFVFVDGHVASRKYDQVYGIECGFDPSTSSTVESPFWGTGKYAGK